MKVYSSIFILIAVVVATHLNYETTIEKEKISLIYALLQFIGYAFLFYSIGKEENNKYKKWLVFYPLSWVFGILFLLWGLDFLFDDFIKTYRIYISILLGFSLCITHYLYQLRK